ncbi:phytoene/squalene synthase family protein [candidate division KSB1 bacterium]
MNYSDKQLRESYSYCKKLTIRSDSNFALSFRFLPKPKQNAIYAVYAFNRCADDFADEIENVDHSLNKLQKWEYMLNECYNGNASHPVMIAFADAINKYNIPKQPFQDAIDGFKTDLTVKRYETFEDLARYCDLVAGTISTISLHIFGFKDKIAFKYGKYLSYALQLTNIIRDVGVDIDKDRIYLPKEDLEKYEYSETELFLKEENRQFLELMSFQIKRAEDYFTKANPLIGFIEKDSQFTVTIIGAVYSRLLKKIRESGIPVLDKVVQLTKTEKLLTILNMKKDPKFI